MYKMECIQAVFRGFDLTQKAMKNGAKKDVWIHAMKLYGLELITARALPFNEATHVQIPSKH